MSFLISLFTGGFSGYYKIALYFALIFSGYYVEHLRFAHYVDQQAIVAQEQADKTKAIQKTSALMKSLSLIKSYASQKTYVQQNKNAFQKTYA